jgi:hypothetical protein
MYHSGLFYSGFSPSTDAKFGFGFDADMTAILWRPLYAAVYQNATVVADPASIERRMATDASAKSCKPTPVPSKIVISSSLVRPA